MLRIRHSMTLPNPSASVLLFGQQTEPQQMYMGQTTWTVCYSSTGPLVPSEVTSHAVNTKKAVYEILYKMKMGQGLATACYSIRPLVTSELTEVTTHAVSTMKAVCEIPKS